MTIGRANTSAIQQENMGIFNLLPHEILLYLLSFSGISSCLQLSVVSHTFNHLINTDDNLWAAKIAQYFPLTPIRLYYQNSYKSLFKSLFQKRFAQLPENLRKLYIVVIENDLQAYRGILQSLSDSDKETLWQETRERCREVNLFDYIYAMGDEAVEDALTYLVPHKSYIYLKEIIFILLRLNEKERYRNYFQKSFPLLASSTSVSKDDIKIVFETAAGRFSQQVFVEMVNTIETSNDAQYLRNFYLTDCLAYAIAHNNKPIIQYLITSQEIKDLDPSLILKIEPATTYEGHTAIAYMLHSGDLSLLQALLKRLKPESAEQILNHSEFGMFGSLLHYLIFSSTLPDYRELSSRYFRFLIDGNYLSQNTQIKALYYAARHGAKDILGYLLSKNVPTNQSYFDDFIDWPIHVAARYGQKEAVMKLFDASKNHMSETEILELIDRWSLSNPSDPDFMINLYKTNMPELNMSFLLFYAYQNYYSEAVTEAVWRAGGELTDISSVLSDDALNMEKLTCLELLVEQGHLNAVKDAKKHNFQEFDKLKNKLLTIAAQKGHYNIFVYLIIECGAEVNSILIDDLVSDSTINIDKKTLCLKMLSQFKNDIHQKIIHAVYTKNSSSLRLLLSTNPEIHNDKTLIKQAYMNSFTDGARLLLRYGLNSFGLPPTDLQEQLLKYIQETDQRVLHYGENHKRHTFFGMGGYTSAEKRAAAENLLYAVMGKTVNLQPHLGALQNGRLADLYQAYNTLYCSSIENKTTTRF